MNLNKKEVLKHSRSLEALAIANLIRGDKKMYNHLREMCFLAEVEYAEMHGTKPIPAVLHTIEDCDKVLEANGLPDSETMTKMLLLK